MTPSRRGVLAGMAAALVLPWSARADKPLLLILTSGSTPRSEAIVTALKAGTDGATRVTYELGPEVDAAAFLADGTRDMAVSAVVAVGDRAFVAAAREFATAPLIHADVTDPSAAGGRPNVVGLALRPDAARGLARIREVFPRLYALGLVRGRATPNPRGGMPSRPPRTPPRSSARSRRPPRPRMSPTPSRPSWRGRTWSGRSPIPSSGRGRWSGVSSRTPRWSRSR